MKSNVVTVTLEICKIEHKLLYKDVFLLFVLLLLSFFIYLPYQKSMGRGIFQHIGAARKVTTYIQTVSSSETLVAVYQTIRRHTKKYRHFNIYYHEQFEVNL